LPPDRRRDEARHEDPRARPTFDEAQAIADATAALYRFYEVRNWCLENPQIVDSSCFDSVAVDQVLDGYRETLVNIQREG